jgi:phage/plasmid-associated DNA primase
MGARQQGGANPELAKLQDKRLVVFGEPEKGKKFNSAQIKLMTGQHSISARALYSNNTHIDLTCLYLCELNGLVPFNDSGTSLEDRIVIVRFNSYFTEDPEEYNDPNPPRPTFKADVRMRDWFNKNWCAFVPLLMEHMRIMDMSCGIDLRQFETPEMRQEVLDYVNRGNDLYQFIKDHYNFTKNNSDVVRVEEIRTLYKDTFNRKNISADNFTQMIKENNKLKRRYIQDKIVDGTRIRRSMVGLTPKYDCDSEEECDGI